MQQLFTRVRAAEDAPPWGLLAALLTVIIAYAFFSVVGLSLGSLLFAQDARAALSVGWLAGGLLTIAAVLFGQRGQTAGLQLGNSYPALIAFGVGLGAAVTTDLLAIPFTGRVIETPELSRLIGPVAAPALLWGVLGLFVVVVQPVAEELVFRGMLFPALRAAQNVWAALGVSSMLYALFHQMLYTYPTPFGGMWWYTLTEPLLIGLVLGVVRAATGSTTAAIMAHVGVGVFALLKALLIVGIVG